MTTLAVNAAPVQSAGRCLKLRRDDAKLRLGHSAEVIQRVQEEVCHRHPEIGRETASVQRCLSDRLVALGIESRGADRYLHFSQKKDRFSGRYDHYGYRIQKRATEVMTRLGLHEFTLGEWDASRGQGNESTAKGAKATMDWVVPLIADIDAETQEYPEPILLKDRVDKTLKEYVDFDQTLEMRRQVNRINQTLGSQVLFGANGNQLHFTPGARHFLDDFETGGGFFYSLQNTPKPDRRRWGQLVGAEKRAMAEVDIEAAHLTMLYAVADRPLPEGNLYEISGYPRLLTKRAFNTLVNAGSTQEAVGSLAHDIFQNKHGLRVACGLSGRSAFEPDTIEVEQECERLAADVIRATKVKHKAIRKAFGSDIGVKLQKWLADIMLESCDRMIRQTGRCPHPIHDGAMVVDIDADEFVKTLKGVGREHGLDLKVKTITAIPEACPEPSVNQRLITPPTTTSNHMGVHTSDLVISSSPRVLPTTSRTVSNTSQTLINVPPRPPNGSNRPPGLLDNPAGFDQWLKNRTTQADAAMERAVMRSYILPERFVKERTEPPGDSGLRFKEWVGQVGDPLVTWAVINCPECRQVQRRGKRRLCDSHFDEHYRRYQQKMAFEATPEGIRQKKDEVRRGFVDYHMRLKRDKARAAEKKRQAALEGLVLPGRGTPLSGDE